MFDLCTGFDCVWAQGPTRIYHRGGEGEREAVALNIYSNLTSNQSHPEQKKKMVDKQRLLSNERKQDCDQ